MYRATVFLVTESFVSGATTEMRTTWDDAGGGDPDYWFQDDTWTGTPGDWDGYSPAFFATAGTNITFTVTVTGTITYEVYYRLERLE